MKYKEKQMIDTMRKKDRYVKMVIMMKETMGWETAVKKCEQKQCKIIERQAIRESGEEEQIV